MLFVVALVVHEPDAAVEFLPHQGDVFLFALPAVSAGCTENEDIFVRDSGPVEPFH